MSVFARALVVTTLAFIPGFALAQESRPRILSPHDTTSQTIGSAHLVVDYGRPSKRRREIFGSLVPDGAIWRTGANEATLLRTDRDLSGERTTTSRATSGERQ